MFLKLGVAYLVLLLLAVMSSWSAHAAVMRRGSLKKATAVNAKKRQQRWMGTEHLMRTMRRNDKSHGERAQIEFSAKRSGSRLNSTRGTVQDGKDGASAHARTHSGALSKLVVGFHTSSVERYSKMLEAQFETWLANFPKDRVLVAGGPHDNVGAATGGLCPNDRNQSCKDAAILYAAAQKVAETGSEWFLGAHEDLYIRMDLLAKTLPMWAKDTERPVIFTGVGCGQSWQYNERSRNGTLPPPPGWVNPRYSCPSVWQHGGLCTGAAYFINRAALQKITKGYDRVEDFMHEYFSHWQAKEPAMYGRDLLLACFLRDEDVAMEQTPLGEMIVHDIADGWWDRSNEMKRGHVVYNVEGPAGKGRERLPTFLREAHARFLGELGGQQPL
jgi:hypothetical protein